MSSIHDSVRYMKEKCAICGYNWDYPQYNRELLTPVQRLYYMDVHLCPICLYSSEHISTVSETEQNLVKEKEYLAIIASKNKQYAITNHKDVVQYLAYAFMKEKMNDYFVAGKAYLCASEIELELASSYSESLLYTPNDKAMIDKSKELAKEYNKKALIMFDKFFKSDNDSVDEWIVYIHTLLLNGLKDRARLVMGDVIKLRPNVEQVAILKEMSKELR